MSAIYTMPDSVCPYMDAKQRAQLTADAVKGVYDTIPNRLGGKSWIENNDENSVTYRFTPSMTMQVTAQQDTITVIETLCAPICSNLTRHYNYAWILLGEVRSKWDAELTDEEKEQLF
jgi:hypothetical protein